MNIHIRPAAMAAVFSTLCLAPAARADQPVGGLAEPGGALTLAAAAGAGHNLDGDDPDAGAGPTGLVRVGYRTAIGLEPFATILYLGVPAHDAPPAAAGLGLRYTAPALLRLAPHVEAAALHAGQPAAMLGAGLSFAIDDRWHLGLFADYITTGGEVDGQPTLLEGIELTIRL